MGSDTSEAILNKELVPSITKQDALDYYYLHWNTRGVLPNVADVALQFDVNPVVVQNLVNSDSFRRSLIVRGVPLSKKSVLSSEQLKCIAIVTDPTRKGGLKSRLREAGIPYPTYQSWMVQPEFRDSVNKLAERILENSFADVNTGLVEAATKGDVAAVKFYYELTGRYDPANKQVMDVMSVLAQVVEIIQRHVSDPKILESMANELTMLSAVAAPGAGRTISQ
jgi:hypothetical protein